MIDPLPEWARQTPNLESLHNLPDVPWGGYNGQGVPLPSLPDLAQFVGKFLEKFLEQVVMAVVGFFIPGISSFEQLKEWAENLGAQITSFIYTTAGINLASWDDFVASLADGKGIDLPLLKFGLDTLAGLFGGISMGDPMTPAERMEWAVTHLIEPLNLLLGPNSPLSAANLFGRLGLGQFGGGVPLNALTPSVANELEPFTALSVPTSDGWSFNATEDAAQLICDGSPKALYLKSGVIKVEVGQPLDTSIDVKYSGIVSGVGQTIRFVLETFTTDDGSGTATPVIVGGVTNPSGTAGPVTLGDSSWDIPVGVKSVRPVLEADELITAGTVFWLNTPELFKQLAGPLAGGLPAAIQDRIDDLQATWDKFKGSAGGTVDDIEGALDGAGQAIRDAIANALGHAGSGHTSANILTYLQSIPQTVVSGLGDLNTLTNQIRDILAGLVVTPINSTVAAIKDWFTGVVGKTQNLTSGGTLPPTSVDSAAGGTSLGQDLLDTWNKIVGGYRRTAATGQTSADVEEVMMSVGQEILVAQESTITLANQANAPRNVPFWVSPNRFEEVSFPRALLQPVPTIGTGGGGSTGTGSGLGVLDANWNAEERDAVQGHTHSAPSHSHVMGFAKPLFTIPAGTLALTAITMTQDRLINVSRFLAGGGTPPSTALYIGLYAIDPATGTMTLVYDYGDQKGNINTGADLYETALNLPNDMLADAGAMFAVGILPVGGSFAVAGVRRQPIVTASVIYPVAATELVSGQSSLPATVDNSSMSHTATHRIWVSLGQAVESIPEDNSPVTLTMTFNVSNTSAWSSPSFQQYGNASSNFTVKDGNIYGGGPTVLFGDVSYVRSALCLTPVHTNDHMAEITLGTGWDDDAYGYATDRAYVRCNSSGTSGVCLHVDATGGAVRVRIATITNLTSIGTVRATVSGIAYAVGDRFSIRAVGNVYTAYRNDSPILDGNGDPVAWTDSGNTVPVGKAWRRTAFGSGSRATNGFSHYEPAHIHAFKAADLAA